jgi:hypothetical protein
LALTLAAFAALGVAARSEAQPPSRDVMFGKGSAQGFPSFEFVVTSGPAGEDPEGRSMFVFSGATYINASPKCLEVSGNTATAVAPSVSTPGAWGKATVVDNGSTGDTVFAENGTGPAPDCARPATTIGGQVTSGNVVVINAKPPPPRASLKLKPRATCSSPVKAVVKAIDGNRPAKVVLSLDGRRVVRTKQRRFRKRLSVRGLDRGLHELRLVFVDRDGARAVKTRSFRSCTAR